jgi:hypothetical protein
VIVLKVNVDGIFTIKGESEPQVAGHGDCPTPFLIAPERVQPPARNVHVLCAGGSIQTVQHSSDPRTMFVRNSARGACGEELAEAFMTEVADHITPEVDSNALLYRLSSNTLQQCEHVLATLNRCKEIIVAIPEQGFSLPAYHPGHPIVSSSSDAQRTRAEIQVASLNDTGFPLSRE